MKELNLPTDQYLELELELDPTLHDERQAHKTLQHLVQFRTKSSRTYQIDTDTTINVAPTLVSNKQQTQARIRLKRRLAQQQRSNRPSLKSPLPYLMPWMSNIDLPQILQNKQHKLACTGTGTGSGKSLGFLGFLWPVL
jgi:hypothetical protein